MLTPKIPPTVGDASTDRVIRQIYNDINSVIEVLNKASSPSGLEGGKQGDVRTEKLGGSNQYVVRFRSQDGWLEISDPTILVFKDKTS